MRISGDILINSNVPGCRHTYHSIGKPVLFLF